MRHLAIALVAAALAVACSDPHEKLMKELDDQSPVVRAGAVRSLAQLGDDEAYTLVSGSLRDPSAVVRIAAVKALARFERRDTTAALIRASRDRDPEVRAAAVDALAEQKGDLVESTLIGMLLKGEPNTEVRRRIYAALERIGLDGERLAGEMAESQMSMARKRMREGDAAERQRVVRMAGRSVHPGGIDLVLAGLADRDQDVALVALRMLDGRGGQAALGPLQLLLSDQVSELRLAAVRALADYGRDGLKLLEAALRDPDPRVRLAALEALAADPEAVAGEALCRLLTDGDPRIAIRAAGLVHRHPASCPLEPVAALLAADAPGKVEQGLAVLSAVGGEQAIDLLEAELEEVAAQRRLAVLAALARAGQKRPGVVRGLENAFAAAVDEALGLAERWIEEPIPPRGRVPGPVDRDADDERTGERPKSRLTDDELNALYRKHGLDPADADSPRGVDDILGRFAQDVDKLADRRLFDPIGSRLVDAISMALDGLLSLDPAKVGASIERVLVVDSPALVARIAQVLRGHGVEIALSEAHRRAIGRALEAADAEQAEMIAAWIAELGDRALAPMLIQAMPGTDWDKRVALIRALGSLGAAEAVPVLIEALSGYAAIPAARALARIGDPEAIGPLRKALEQAGPAEEMELLMALARLGSREEIPRLLEKLDAADPEVRRAGVRVLGEVAGERELDAIKGLRYDLDRLVRREVRRVLERGQRGEGSDDAADSKDQGRGGPAAETR